MTKIPEKMAWIIWKKHQLFHPVLKVETWLVTKHIEVDNSSVVLWILEAPFCWSGVPSRFSSAEWWTLINSFQDATQLSVDGGRNPKANHRLDVKMKKLS